VRVVAVDDVHFQLGVVVVAPEPVRHHRAAGSASEDYDSLPCHLGLLIRLPKSLARTTLNRIGADNYGVA
jgi:hypothetical protein